MTKVPSGKSGKPGNAAGVAGRGVTWAPVTGRLGSLLSCGETGLLALVRFAGKGGAHGLSRAALRSLVLCVCDTLRGRLRMLNISLKGEFCLFTRNQKQG